MSKGKSTDKKRDGRTTSAIKRRITNEVNRLKKIYGSLRVDQLVSAEGLIRRAAYMLVTLEDMEEDMILHGSVEMFSQSAQAEPYERLRPVAQNYNTLNKNYQSIIKQLSDMLPKAIEDGPVSIDNKTDDGFDDFAKRSERT